MIYNPECNPTPPFNAEVLTPEEVQAMTSQQIEPGTLAAALVELGRQLWRQPFPERN